ncbi:DotU family type IV/VI secretion system protein [Chromobacterium haemolyticum]|nr:DotU family type IV/VI secretion system protein [Chromobacterium haemolyticum]
MLDSALSQPLGALAQAPLSATFEDAYAEWLQVFRELAGGGHKAETAAELAAEQGGLLARRLSRAAGARVGAAGQSQIEALQYLFVALIDERLLFEDWPGQSLWQATPLEQRLFGSRAAGDKVPALIERVLRERDPASRDLANVCLQTLTLGFYGRLRGQGGLAQHEEWRRELFAFAYSSARRRHPRPGAGAGAQQQCAAAAADGAAHAAGRLPAGAGRGGHPGGHVGGGARVLA